jgi:hypothetical protein
VTQAEPAASATSSGLWPTRIVCVSAKGGSGDLRHGLDELRAAMES